MKQSLNIQIFNWYIKTYQAEKKEKFIQFWVKAGFTAVSLTSRQQKL